MACRSPRIRLAIGIQLRDLISHCWLFSWLTRAEITVGRGRTMTAVRDFSSRSLISAFDMSTPIKASPWMIHEPSSQRDSPTRTSATFTRVDTRYRSRSSWTIVGPVDVMVGRVSRIPKSHLPRIEIACRGTSPRAARPRRRAAIHGSSGRLRGPGSSGLAIGGPPRPGVGVDCPSGGLAIGTHAPPCDLLVAAGDGRQEGYEDGPESLAVSTADIPESIEHGLL